MITKESAEFFMQAQKMNAKQQEEFFEALKGTISEEEAKALKIGIAYFSMMMSSAKQNAMKSALAETLYKEFTGNELNI